MNANKIILKDIGSNGKFVNNFTSLTANEDVELIVGDKWFQFEADIVNQRSCYLYLSGTIDQDITVQLFRSGGIVSLDIDYAVPIPGGILTMAVTTPGTPERVSIDFNISNFGGDILWMKTTGTVGLSANILDEVNVILKR